MIGKTLAHYEVLAHLGSGGMGEVYRARDTKLGREVALKTLRPELLDDAERIARFEREARSLATLQHANVASIYGWEEAQGNRFLVMELVEGEDLARRLARGPLPEDEAVAIAVQVCDGLGAAHDKGLVHRDLKPANIMLTPDGQVKILDFGLARAWAGDGDDADAANSPTITAAMTRAGTILGTAAYMSPEQARGRSADRRTDIWAVGVVLWEMLTGRQLFAGETVTDTLAAVLTRDLDLDALPATTPTTVRRGLARCLVRDPKQRLHDVNDLRLELLANDAPEVPGAPGRAGPAVIGRLALITAVLVVVAAAVGLFAGRRSVDVPSPPVVRMTLSGAGSNGWSVSAISPDGQTIAWAPIHVSGTASIHVHRLDGFEERILAGTEDGANPAFSPDGRWLAYLKVSERQLYKVPVEGGTPQRLAPCDFNTVQIEWSDDGYIYYSGGASNIADRGVHRVPEGGGPSERVANLTGNEGQLYHPCRVPGTDWLLYTAENSATPLIRATRVGGDETTAVVADASSPRFLPPDILLFYRVESAEVLAVHVDLETMQPRTEPVPVLDQVPSAVQLSGCFDVARDGTVIYNHSTERGLMSARRQLDWADADGTITPVFAEEASWAQPRISPDGRHIVVRQVQTPNCILWSYDIVRGTRVRVTFDEDAHNPLWNPATGGVVFRYDEGSTFFIAERRADGTGETRTLWAHEQVEFAPTSISADGRWLLVNALVNERDIWAIDLESGGEPRPFVSTPFREQDAAMSPDGRWVAYTSDESGRDEIYVVSWPEATDRQQISVAGGHDPSWARDGARLYFLLDQQVMAVAMTPGTDLAPGMPTVAFTGNVDGSNYNHAYDMMPGGERAVWIGRPAKAEDQADLRVVAGWRREVLERLGG